MLLRNAVFGIFAAASALALQSGAAQALDRVSIGTGPAGTLYNQIGTTMAGVLQREMKIPANTRPFSGTTVYLPPLAAGELNAGINSSVESRSAYLGEGVFEKPVTTIRALATLNRAPFQFFARGSDNITSVEQLKGKKVVTQYRTIRPFDAVISSALATAGLTDKDVEAVVMAGVPDAIRAVSDGRVDAAVVALNIPPLREADATLQGGIRVLTMGPKEDAVNSVPGLEVGTIGPGPASVGIPVPTRVTYMPVYLNSNTHVSADDAYTMVKTVYDNWAEMQEALPALRSTKQADFLPARVSHPFHDGAIRFFKEIGLWTAQHQADQDALLKP